MAYGIFAPLPAKTFYSVVTTVPMVPHCCGFVNRPVQASDLSGLNYNLGYLSIWTEVKVTRGT